ncbi:MAG: hypothetical protein PHU51_05360 [Candidatus Nanoarchaeia archaeon]|nr:hypothetical protein [Candidatus Nanoarchaeia archaeon]
MVRIEMLTPEAKRRILEEQAMVRRKQQEYQEYQKQLLEQQQKQSEVARWRKYFLAYDNSRRGKPFVLGLNPSREDVRMYNEVRKAMLGQNSSVPPDILNHFKGGMTKSFSSSPSVFGLDVGQKSTITTKDKEGKVIRFEEYKKILEDKKPVIQYSKTDYVYRQQPETSVTKQSASKQTQGVIITPKTIRTSSPTSVGGGGGGGRSSGGSVSLSSIKIPNVVKNNVQKVINTGSNLINVVSGGSIEETKINKLQVEQNKRVERFNEKYGGKELDEDTYKQAERELEFLKEGQKVIDNRWDSFIDSTANKVNDFYKTINKDLFYGSDKRMTTEQQRLLDEKNKVNQSFQKRLQQNMPIIQKYQEDNLKKERQLNNLNMRNPVDWINGIRLQNRIDNNNKNINTLLQGRKIVVMAEPLPFILKGYLPINKISKVSFLSHGRKLPNGAYLTTTLYKTNKGGIGIGINIAVKGYEGKITSFGVTRLGKIVMTPVTRTIKIVNWRSILTGSRGVAKSKGFRLSQLIRASKFKKVIQPSFEYAKKLKVTQTFGIGRSISVKEKSFNFVKLIARVTPKLKQKGLSVQDFAYIANNIPRKRLNYIAGKTISTKGRRTEFVGILKNWAKKGGGSGTKITSTNKQLNEYSRALEEVVSSVTNEFAKIESKTIGTKSALIGATIQSLGGKIPKTLVAKIKLEQPSKINATTQNVIKTKPTTRTLVESRTGVQTLTKNRQEIRSIQMQMNYNQSKINQLNNTLTKTKNRTLQRQKINQISRIRIQQRQLLKLLTKLKTQQKLLLKTTLQVKTPSVPMGSIHLGGFYFNLAKGDFKKKNLSKSVMGYYVLIKRNNRLIKTTPRPFELSGAKDYLAYLIDHSLSKTAFIIPDGKTKNVYVLPKTQQNYYQKASHKLRPYRIRYGKKKQLVNGYIEKRKYGLDTANEKRELKLSKRINRRTVRRTTKRKITPAQRKVLLKRLEKARAVRRRTTTPRRTTIKVNSSPRIKSKRKISPAERKVLLARLKMARRVKARGRLMRSR